MTRWPWLLGLVLIFGALAGMGSCGTPAGPTYSVKNNTGVVNITTGSTSPVSTAPCGATASQKNLTGDQNAPTQDCSTQANGNTAPTVGPEAVLP